MSMATDDERREAYEKLRSRAVDREALLALADEMQSELDECESDHEIAGKYQDKIDRIRKAIGEGES